MASLLEEQAQLRRHDRKPTMPFARSSRHGVGAAFISLKEHIPRALVMSFGLPSLALRFSKGAIHRAVLLPVIMHSLFACLVAYIDQTLDFNLGLPSTIIPSLSIVVGLMLVFRNQTSYNRFWDGRNDLSLIITVVRNLSRAFIVCNVTGKTAVKGDIGVEAGRAELERIIRILIAILFATKNHLRAAWGAEVIPGAALNPGDGGSTRIPEYNELLPRDFKGLDDRGVGLPVQLTFFVEHYIKRQTENGTFQAPQASQMQVQLYNMTDAFGRMETIRLTSIPVAILIHQTQVLALFNCVLPFALVDEIGWWTVPIVSLVAFTLFGIDAIGSQLEDPFGFDRNDIAMDTIVEDIREEVMVLLDEWRRIGSSGGEMFILKGTAEHLNAI